MATARASTLRGDWLTRGTDDVLSAYAPADGAVLRWSESRTGWGGPEQLPVPRLTPGLTVAQGTDGYVHLAGLRRTGSGDECELVHAVQFQTGRPLLGWTSLGHPNKRGPWTGDPVTAVDGEGRLCVFVRNRGTGVSCRAQGDRAGWKGWQDLGGKGTGESLAAAVDAEGRVELFVPDAKSIARYTQVKPGAAFALGERLEVPPAPGAFSAIATSSGSVSLFFTDGDGFINVWAPERDAAPVRLLEAAGTGPLVLARTEIDGCDCTVLAQESGAGQVAFAAYPTEQETAGGWWSGTDTRTQEDAGSLPLVLRAGPDGGLIAMALAPGEKLIATRQKVAAGGFALGRWKPVP